MFTLDTLHFLQSARGETLLARLAVEDLSDSNTLRLLTQLRREYSGDEAGAALELARLRIEAVGKFGASAGRMFFTRAALEQATDPHIRRFRATHLPTMNDDECLLDLCCSIGSDGLAFAAAGVNVLGYDLDPVRVAMARLNAAALGVTAQFEVADVQAISLDSAAAFYDPARRDGAGKRIHHVEAYQPPLSLIQRFSGWAWQAKLSPGVDVAQLASYVEAGAGLAFHSVNGDLKEAALHKGWGDSAMTAYLHVGETTHVWARSEDVPSRTSLPRAWLFEPDPALIRIGDVSGAAAQLGLFQLDETIAYLTGDTRPETPWLRAWRILDWMPFNVKKLRAYLREQQVGSVQVKKRGTAVTPEVLIPQLKLKGDEERVLVLTRCQEKQIVVVCEAYSAP